MFSQESQDGSSVKRVRVGVECGKLGCVFSQKKQEWIQGKELMLPGFKDGEKEF